MNLKIFTDGGSRGNPGDSGIGIVVYNDKKVIYDQSTFIGTATNNEAEYEALLKALDWLSKNKKGVDEVNFYLDSKLVVEQVNKNWKTKDERMRSFVNTIWKFIEDFDFKTTFSYVKRDKNKEADSLVNQALDAHQI